MKRTILMALVLALVGCARATAVTTTYEFIPDESTVVYYGGTAGQFTSSIEGQFQLTVDYDAGIAWFNNVDATLSRECFYIDGGEVLSTQSLGVLFRMSQLESTDVSDAQIDFLLERNMPTFPDADIDLRLMFMEDSVHMTGDFSQPVYDGGWYDLDGFAVPEPVTVLLLGLGGLLLRKRN